MHFRSGEYGQRIDKDQRVDGKKRGRKADEQMHSLRATLWQYRESVFTLALLFFFHSFSEGGCGKKGQAEEMHFRI